MNEAERMNLPPRGDVAASIEARQRRRPAPPAGEGNVTMFAPSGIVIVDAEGREVPIQPDPRIALYRAESDAREAFERAVLDDFASTPQLYVVWWIAHLDAGGRGISPFAEAVQVVLMARVNRKAP